MRSSLLPLTVVLLLLESCAQETDSPETAPTSRPTSVAKPAAATGDEAALALARKVRAYAGGDEAWAKVDNIVLTFMGQRRLLWDVRAGKVRIEPILKPGQPPGRGLDLPLVYDIDQDRGARLGPAEIARRVPLQPTATARGQWTNDFYWLLVPLKVLDAGVKLSIDARQDDDPEDVARLHLRFDAVGMTPSNEYVLHVETETGKIVRWDYFVNAKVPPRSWGFAGYRKVGPLNLSLSRPALGEGPDIELTDVAVNVELPADIWTAAEPRIEAPK